MCLKGEFFMQSKKTKIQTLYSTIRKMDRQITNLNKKKEMLIQKTTNIIDNKINNQVINLIEETIEKIDVLEKKKAVIIAHMAELTKMVEINVLEDPYIRKVINGTKVENNNLLSIHLYGSINYGYTITSTRKISNITQNLSLEEFETKQESQKIPTKRKKK